MGQGSIKFLLLLQPHVIDADFMWGARLPWLNDSWHDGVDLEQPTVQELDGGHVLHLVHVPAGKHLLC